RAAACRRRLAQIRTGRRRPLRCRSWLASASACCAQHSAIRERCTAADRQQASEVRITASHYGVPAKTGIHSSDDKASEKWVPAFAGTRIKGAADNRLGGAAEPRLIGVAPSPSFNR